MFYDDVGGIYYWPQTNRLGVLPSKKKKNGSYKIADPSIITKRYKRYELFLKQGDVSFFDSLFVISQYQTVLKIGSYKSDNAVFKFERRIGSRQ